ncbi:MAG: PEP-utilizing enzyme [Turneriella sp.]|nr:PEP-utilizing enzyme [Leptospiraceae bacterium]MCX7632185.1 PEP-utilizing enzyme [Turneriella sp.]
MVLVGMRHIRARSICPGRIRGLMVEFRRERFLAEPQGPVDPKNEYRQFRSALRAAQLQLAGEKKMMLETRRKNPQEVAAIDEAINVLESHILTLEDPFFIEEIKNRIFESGATAAAALGAVINMVSRQFTFENPSKQFDGGNRHFLKDMNDMKRRILHFLGLKQEFQLPPGVSIVAASRLTVSEVLALKRAGVRGIIIGESSDTAHEIVMLRAMQIPCVATSDNRLLRPRKPVPVLLDADIGYVVLNPRRNIRFIESNPGDEQRIWSKTVKLRSGEKCQLSGTLHFMSELTPNTSQAQQIGLYRTEYQISEAGELPPLRSLQKQYAAILSSPYQVTFRLFDFSRDKNFLSHPLIARNPGLRGIRFLLVEKKVLELQVTALVRAAEETQKKLFVLIPYLSEWYELNAVRNLLRAHCDRKTPPIVLGGMLEHPGAVFNASHWVDELDFVYIGTSDLLSALAAVGREDSSALEQALLSDAFVAIAGTLKQMARKRPVTLCGELVGEPWAISWLFGLGFRNFVLPTLRLPVVSNMLGALSREKASQFVRTLLKLPDSRKRVEKAKHLALGILYGMA